MGEGEGLLINGGGSHPSANYIHKSKFNFLRSVF